MKLSIPPSPAYQPSNEAQASVRGWMGEFGVYDHAGKPLVFYHGTNHDQAIDTFSAGGVAGSRQTGDAYGAGAYLTTSAPEASQYASMSSEGTGSVYPLFVRGNFLHLPLDAKQPLNHNDASLLSAIAQECLMPSDKARFDAGRTHRDFAPTQLVEARSFFEAQKLNFQQFGDGMCRCEPSVESGADGGFRIEYTDFDASIQIKTTGDAVTLLKTIGFECLTDLGYDGFLMERENGSYWAVCLSTLGTVSSALNQDFSGHDLHLCCRPQQQIDRDIANFCKPRLAATMEI